MIILAQSGCVCLKWVWHLKTFSSSLRSPFFQPPSTKKLSTPLISERSLPDLVLAALKLWSRGQTGDVMCLRLEYAHGNILTRVADHAHIRPSIFLRATLKTWEWPGDKAIYPWYTTVQYNVIAITQPFSSWNIHHIDIHGNGAKWAHSLYFYIEWELLWLNFTVCSILS